LRAPHNVFLCITFIKKSTFEPVFVTNKNAAYAIEKNQQSTLPIDELVHWRARAGRHAESSCPILPCTPS